MHQELNSPKGFSLTGLISLLIYYFHMPQQAAIYFQNNLIKSSWAAHWFSNIKSVDRRNRVKQVQKDWTAPMYPFNNQ